MLERTLIVAAVALAVVSPRSAEAAAQGVGLGVAGGVAYSNTEVTIDSTKEAIGARLAWGFFVDIPLLQTFYITPSTMLYELKNAAGENQQVTDVDLNFKFIVPLGDLRLGAGLTGGLTTGAQESYAPHYGALGFVSYNLLANIDGFALVQYKKMLRDSDDDVADVHGFLGGMFHF